LLCVGFIALAGWLVPVSAAAQDAAAPQLARAAQPVVVAARSNDREHPDQIGLGYALTVQVANLGAALAERSAACDKLILFLNDIPLDGLAPDSCDAVKGRVRFTLARTDESTEGWRLLFTEPWEFTNRVSVSVGPKGRLPWPTEAEDMVLVILPTFWVYTFFGGLAVALVVCVYLAWRTALLRDRGEGVADGRQAPYSLSRFQLALWLFLVLAGYVFIWMITGELDTITGSVLALLGIGSGTALGATLIDQNKEEEAAPAAGEGPAAAPPAPRLRPGQKIATRGFLKDLLSDEKGISLYRLQLFIWTLVLGVIFCSSVYSTLAMPQFSPTLLGLMGISSGTYLGFKVPEQRAGPPTRGERPHETPTARGRPASTRPAPDPDAPAARGAAGGRRRGPEPRRPLGGGDPPPGQQADDRRRLRRRRGRRLDGGHLDPRPDGQRPAARRHQARRRQRQLRHQGHPW
jgi:hypothetical protein